MKNNTLQEIGQQLKTAQRILLFPHVQMDGDALGSSVALCLGLRKLGKEVFILLEDKTPDFLTFLMHDCCTENFEVFHNVDACVAIDCSEAQRIEKRYPVFSGGAVRLCLDHHATAEKFADFSYVDPKAPATGEIIYDLLGTMGIEIDHVMADALYVALTTDTGNFCYPNTTKKTHMIVADLFDKGLNHAPLCVELYETVKAERIALRAAALNKMVSFCEGKANMTYVSQEMVEAFHTTMEETEGIIDELRCIRGIEISALLKEKEPGVIKVSLRAKSYGDVAKIAGEFNGGGHIKAAGCTIYADAEQAMEQLKHAIEKQLKEGCMLHE